MKKSDVLKKKKRLKAIRRRKKYLKKHNYQAKTLRTNYQRTLSNI